MIHSSRYLPPLRRGLREPGCTRSSAILSSTVPASHGSMTYRSRSRLAVAKNNSLCGHSITAGTERSTVHVPGVVRGVTDPDVIGLPRCACAVTRGGQLAILESNFVHDLATLYAAFCQVEGNQGANTPDADGMTVRLVEQRIGVREFLDGLLLTA